MKVLLTFLPVVGSHTLKGLQVHPPMAIYLLASLLEQNGHELVLLDPTWYKDHGCPENPASVLEQLKGVDIVAASTNSFNWALTRQFVALVKEANPNIPVVLGGIHPTCLDRYVLETTPVDYIIRGEGEKTFLALLETLTKCPAKLDQVAGLSYKDHEGRYIRNPDPPLLTAEYLREQPLPALDRVPSGRYLAPAVESSRGCLFHCTFCGIMYHRSWRALAVEQVLERFGQTWEVSRGRFQLPDCVVFSDDCFTVNKERTIQILEGLAVQYPRIRFSVEGRLSDIRSKEILDAIPYGQVQRFLVGIESGYDEGLVRIRKGLTTKKIDEILSRVKHTEIANALFCTFIIGFPWETEEDCLRTVRFAAHLVEQYGVQCNVSWHFMVPSVIWDQRAEYGIDVDPSFFDDPHWALGPADSKGCKAEFYRMHPRIDEAAYRRVGEYMSLYFRQGIRLSDYLG